MAAPNRTVSAVPIVGVILLAIVAVTVGVAVVLTVVAKLRAIENRGMAMSSVLAVKMRERGGLGGEGRAVVVDELHFPVTAQVASAAGKGGGFG